MKACNPVMCCYVVLVLPRFPPAARWTRPSGCRARASASWTATSTETTTSTSKSKCPSETPQRPLHIATDLFIFIFLLFHWVVYNVFNILSLWNTWLGIAKQHDVFFPFPGRWQTDRRLCWWAMLRMKQKWREQWMESQTRKKVSWTPQRRNKEFPFFSLVFLLI